MTPDDLRKLFLGALRRIHRYGWQKNHLGNKEVGYCIVGAIDDFYESENPPYGVRNTAIGYLEYSIGVSNLGKWNDEQGSEGPIVDRLLRGAEEPKIVWEWGKGSLTYRYEE